MREIGGPPGNRTPNLRIKSPLLCLIELEAHRRRHHPPERAPTEDSGERYAHVLLPGRTTRLTRCIPAARPPGASRVQIGSPADLPNPRRPGSQPGALPTELRPPLFSSGSIVCRSFRNLTIDGFPARTITSVEGERGSGAPGRTRTCNPRLRRPMLYPVELRARTPSLLQATPVDLLAAPRAGIA